MKSIVQLVSLASVVSCLIGCEPPPAPKKKFYMVTHGASTNQGFWGNVLTGANEEAQDAGVTLIPLHPATEVTGEQLDILMDQAIAAKPDGILATIWGDGMTQRVAAANAAGIPVAAINVYPDSTAYSATGAGGKAKFVLYSGQQDYDAATATTDALICSASGAGTLTGDHCGTTTLAAAYTLAKVGSLAVAVFKNESSGGVNARQQAMIDRIRVLDASATVDVVEWDRNLPGDDNAKISAFFALPRVSGAAHVIVMSASADAIVPLAAYLAAHASATTTLAAGVFDKPTNACTGFTAGWLKFWVDQNESDQGRKALRYLNTFIKTGALPAAGKDTQGTDDAAWTTSVDGYPWYRTGPRFHPSCD